MPICLPGSHGRALPTNLRAAYSGNCSLRPCNLECHLFPYPCPRSESYPCKPRLSQIQLCIGQMLSSLALWNQQHVGGTRVLPALPNPAWSPITPCNPELRWLCPALLGTCHASLVSMVMSVSHANCLWEDYEFIISYVGLALRLLLLQVSTS